MRGEKGSGFGKGRGGGGEKMATIRDIRPVIKERFLPGYEHDRRVERLGINVRIYFRF